LSEIWGDTRFAVRSFRRAPGFAIAAVLVLGIGIGAVSLMFSTFNSVVLQPLPFEQPDRLVWVWGTSERMPRNTIAYPDYVDYRDGTDAFESLAAVMFRRTRVVTGGDGAERVITYPVSANLFTALGISPELGRVFLPEEEETGQDGVAILSHGFWERRYAGDPGVIGSTITLDGMPAEVVGVMPARFVLPVGYTYPAGADVWFPLQRNAGYARGRANNNFAVLGRLREGVSLGQAQAQMDVVARNIADSYPEVKAGIGVTLVPLHERFFGSAREALLMLAGIISLVPLVACANVASLFVARAVSRRTELASRLALGASRARLVRQLLSEGIVVALAGGVVGLAIAFAGGEALRVFAPGALPRLGTIAIDGTVLSVTLAVSILMVPLFGLAPAIRGSDMRIAETLKVGGGRGSSGRGWRFRSILVVAQVALCLMLMLASGLFVRSFANLQSVDPGFQTESVLSINALLPDFKYESREEIEQVWGDVHRRLQAVPGVRTVGFVDNLPLGAEGPKYYVWAAARPPASAAERVPATRRGASQGYFDALGIQLLAGRHFEPTERWSGPGGATVINEALARQFFPGEDPLGKTLVLDWDRPVDLEVIGVTADIHEVGPGSDPIATFYVPVRWYYDMLSVVIGTEGDPLALVGAVRHAIKQVDEDVTLSSIQTMQDRLSDTLFQPRFRSAVVGIFALVTLILSSIGLYGVLAYFVREHSHEISVRLVLGAGMGGVARLVLARGLALVAGGIIIGLVGALVGTRLIESVLFGIGATDPITFCGVSLCLVAVTLVACLVPTLRAVRLDPVEVMKAE
jgi:putative ABC transport system permease protein